MASITLEVELAEIDNDNLDDVEKYVNTLLMEDAKRAACPFGDVIDVNETSREEDEEEIGQ